MGDIFCKFTVPVSKTGMLLLLVKINNVWNKMGSKFNPIYIVNRLGVHFWGTVPYYLFFLFSFFLEKDI